MSFRLYAYYMAIGGAFAALLAWLVSRIVFGTAGETETWKLLLRAALQGAILGALVGAVLGVVDALAASGGRTVTAIPATVTNLILGGLAGLIGGIIGQLLALMSEYLRVIGWLVTGALIGTGLGLPALLKLLLARQEVRGAVRKLRNGAIGGSVGGLLGGIALVALQSALTRITGSGEALSPSGVGWTTLGALIGLFIGLAQIVLRDAWVIVESGFRPGREILITKPIITIGRAEGCDIGLYGAKGVEKLHARILVEGPDYYIEDGQTPGGTFVNERRVSEKRRLQSGDRIRVGDCVLIFRSRARSQRPKPSPSATA
jgi:hypothetical protein